MSEVVSEPVAVPWRMWTIQVALVCATLALPAVLVFATTWEGSDASTTIGIVLVEALVLNIGYGAVTRVAGPPILGLLAGV